MDHKIPYKIYLEEHEMPKEWYNVRADMKKKPAPILPSGDPSAGDGRIRTFRYFLQRVGKAGIRR